MTYDTQYYKTIPIRLVQREYGNRIAKRFVINDTNQNVWIPNKHLDFEGKLKDNEDIDYIFRKSCRQLELAGILQAIPGIKRAAITCVN